MTQMSFATEGLKELPCSIWIPSPENTIYRGTPTEIVDEMVPAALRDRPMPRKVKYLLDELAKRRSLVIGLPGNVTDDILAGLFVYALLDVGIARPAWLA